MCGEVTPSRVLRQRDPLSPYLFIHVVDTFSYTLQRKVQERNLHGTKVSRNGPEITHRLLPDKNAKL